MNSGVKQLVKSVVPHSLLHRAVETRNWVGLASVARQGFSLTLLRALDELSGLDFWTSPEVNAAWEQDRRAIADIYGESEAGGGVTPGERRALYYLTMVLGPTQVLEVGTHVGASTLHMARALKRLNCGGNITTVDIEDVNDSQQAAWKRENLTRCPKEFARLLECAEQINFVTEPSLRLMERTRGRFDLVFLDGDHSARAVYLELSAALRVLTDRGVVLLHDYHPGGKSVYPQDRVISGPFYALERIKRETPGIHVLPLGDLPWPTKQGVSATSLALVGRA